MESGGCGERDIEAISGETEEISLFDKKGISAGILSLMLSDT